MLNILMKIENTKEPKDICGGDVQTRQDVDIKCVHFCVSVISQ